MTEQEKIALLEEFEKLGGRGSGRNTWLKEQLVKHGLTPGSAPYFYRWRQKYLAEQQPAVTLEKPVGKARGRLSAEGLERIREAQRERWAKSKGRRSAAPASSVTSKFASASRDEKLRMVQEYDALPHLEKAAWRERYAANDRTGLLTYYRNQFKKEGALGNGHAPKTTAVVKHQRDEASLVAEYESYPGAKMEWLAARGLNYQSMHMMRLRVAAAPARVQQPTLSHVLPEAAPGPVVTLEDAVAAMQVRIDIYNEVLDHFKRMMRGGR